MDNFTLPELMALYNGMRMKYPIDQVVHDKLWNLIQAKGRNIDRRLIEPDESESIIPISVFDTTMPEDWEMFEL